MSSEDEITSPRTRRRVITDKDDTTESTPRKSDDIYHTTASRSSERLRKKANRTFKLPTRDDVWKDIPHSNTPNKTMSRCMPRLHVNNLFKERHRYNYDPDISSGDESIQDFIDDDDEEVLLDISDTDSENTEQTRKRRITNYHPRIKTESCSEEDGDEERKSGASSSEGSSYQHFNTNSRSFTKKRKYSSQGNSLNTEKESKEDELAPFPGSDIDFSSMVPVKTNVRKANKHESSDTESYSDSNEYVPKSQGSKKRNSADAVVSDTESESVSMHALPSESEQNLTKMKSKAHILDQLQNDSRKNNFDMATVKEADLNPVRPIGEHSELTRIANYVSYGDSGESIEESVNESSDDGEIIRSTHKRQSLVIESDSDDGEIIRSTHKRQSLVIDSDSDAEEFSDPATSSSIRKSNRSEDQMKMKTEARKNLFKEFKAARKRSLSGDNT